MPNIKSAIKRVKVSEKRRQNRKAQTSALRTQIKKTFQAIESAEANVQDRVKATQKQIAQAAAKGLLHKNTAARRQSRIARALNKSA